jgi:hypothetical protein
MHYNFTACVSSSHLPVQICELPAQSSAITALTLNGSLDHVACGTAGGMVHVWEVYSGKEVLRADAPTSVTCLALSPSTKGPVKEVVVGTARGELLVCRKVSSERFMKVVAFSFSNDVKLAIHSGFCLLCAFVTAFCSLFTQNASHVTTHFLFSFLSAICASLQAHTMYSCRLREAARGNYQS